MCYDERLYYLHVLYCQTEATVGHTHVRGTKRKGTLRRLLPPTLVDPADCKLLGKVEGNRVLETPANKKKKSSSKDVPKASKKKASKSTASDDLNSLDEKWSQRFARLEAMILAKSCAVEPIQKTSSAVVTSEKPFFDPEKNAASTSQKITGLVTQPSVLSTTGTSHVQATGRAASFTATQPVEGPGARVITATQHVEWLCKKM